MYQQPFYENLIKSHLPKGADLIVSNKSYSRPLVFGIDIDGDGSLEIVGAYRLKEEAFLIVLKQRMNDWCVVETVKGKGSNVSYFKVAPITMNGMNNLVVGWQVGGIWSQLSIYKWQNNKLLDVVSDNLYFSNIEVNSFSDTGQCSQTDRIALWKHDTGDAYQVEIWQWNNNKLVPALEVYAYYFKKVAKYYTVLTEEFPQSPVYWYYLADSQYKISDFEGALRTLETANLFEKPFPSREVLEALQNAIVRKGRQLTQGNFNNETNNDTSTERANEDEIVDIENRFDSAEKYLFPASVKSKKGQKWGYIDNQGTFVIEPQYSYAMEFQDNGLAVVENQSSKSGVINIQGEYVVAPSYDMITKYAEARAAAVDDKGYWMIDEVGNVITKKAYNYIGDFNEGRALYTDVNEQGDFLYGYLDRQGIEVIPMKYQSGTNFNKGKAVVKLRDNESALIGLGGEVYHTYPYGNVGEYSEGLLSFQKDPSGKYGYINEQGVIVISPEYTWAQTFDEGRAIVNSTENYINQMGLIDKKGRYIIKPEYNSILNLKEDRYAVGKALDETQPFLGSKYAIVDSKGTLLTDYVYHNVSEYSQGVASVDDGERTFFIDEKGEQVMDFPSIAGTGTMNLEGDGSLIKVNIDMRVFYLDRAGKVIWRQNKVIQLKGTYKVLEKKYMPNKDYLVYVPAVEGMKDKSKQESVNKELKLLSKVRPIDRDTQLDFSYTGDFSIQFFKKQLVVFELSGNKFPFGAAHGMPTKTYPHVNLVTGEFYQLADLFKENSDYVKVLSEIIGEQIKADPQYSYVFPDSYKGIEPDQPFYVSRNALYIYFAPYEIGPYVAGFPTFKIPYTDLQNVINKQGSLWKAFNYEK